MEQIIGKKSYLALFIRALAFLICSLIVIITFIKTNEWVVRFVVSFVFGIGSLITFIPLLRCLLTPRKLIILDDKQIILPSKKAKFNLSDISSISGFEEPNGSNRNFWSLITKHGYLTIWLKNDKRYSLNYIADVLEVEKKLKALISDAKIQLNK